MPYSSINRVTLVGNLTQDPELRELSSGRSVCRLRLACSGRRRNADGGYDSTPKYFDVSVFGPQGETVHRYLRKGRPVAIDGRLDWSEWETPEGERRQAVTIVADDVQFLGGGDRSGSGGDGGDELAAGDEDVVAAREASEAELVA
ncbi:MAG: single-stranded DNA-binding protein [Acidobacteriota bacterium]|nr:single-stranded DNA-binding protein [Acidobacteriota bacterium]